MLVTDDCALVPANNRLSHFGGQSPTLRCLSAGLCILQGSSLCLCGPLVTVSLSVSLFLLFLRVPSDLRSSSVQHDPTVPLISAKTPGSNMAPDICEQPRRCSFGGNPRHPHLVLQSLQKDKLSKATQLERGAAGLMPKSTWVKARTFSQWPGCLCSLVAPVW